MVIDCRRRRHRYITKEPPNKHVRVRMYLNCWMRDKLFAAVVPEEIRRSDEFVVRGVSLDSD